MKRETYDCDNCGMKDIVPVIVSETVAFRKDDSQNGEKTPVTIDLHLCSICAEHLINHLCCELNYDVKARVLTKYKR